MSEVWGGIKKKQVKLTNIPLTENTNKKGRKVPSSPLDGLA
jgi:hypothetical protein